MAFHGSLSVSNSSFPRSTVVDGNCNCAVVQVLPTLQLLCLTPFEWGLSRQPLPPCTGCAPVYGVDFTNVLGLLNVIHSKFNSIFCCVLVLFSFITIYQLGLPLCVVLSLAHVFEVAHLSSAVAFTLFVPAFMRIMFTTTTITLFSVIHCWFPELFLCRCGH